MTVPPPSSRAMISLRLAKFRRLRSHGLRCPEDVSIVGFNDMAFAETSGRRLPRFTCRCARLAERRRGSSSVELSPVSRRPRW